MGRNKTAYIVGAAPFQPAFFHPKKQDVIIAADGGLAALRSISVTPQLVMGDFDSLGETPKNIPVLKYPARKDDTDMALALEQAVKMGCTDLRIFGGLGGQRMEHTLGNLQLMADLSLRKIRCIALGEDTACAVISDGRIRFAKEAEGFISVFSLSDQAEGVTIQGLSYELENGSLTNRFPLGVSNEFAGKSAVIQVEKGTLALFYHGPAEWIRSVTFFA